MAAITLLLYPLKTVDPGVSSGVLYVLGVLLVSIYWGVWLGLLTSVASALALDIFHASSGGDPLSASTGDLVAIGVLLLTASVASLIADRARLRADDAEARLRLEAELRQRDAERIRFEEVHASRARVMGAADEERRRVVRDLHDGAQQRLVHTVITLKLAKRALENDDGSAEALVSEALEQAKQATTELRELVHGILPAVLSRGGLRAALNGLASRLPLPVTLNVPVARLPPPVEATAYFVVAEALTNIVKHAHAHTASVTAMTVREQLEIEVRDDGVGGARTDGGGLLELEDRVAVLNGRLRVESASGTGTLVAATIPLRDYAPEPRR